MTEGVFVPASPGSAVYQRGGSFLRALFIPSAARIPAGFRAAQFNYSEFAGNAVAAGISNLYYPRKTAH